MQCSILLHFIIRFVLDVPHQYRCDPFPRLAKHVYISTASTNATTLPLREEKRNKTKSNVRRRQTKWRPNRRKVERKAGKKNKNKRWRLRQSEVEVGDANTPPCCWSQKQESRSKIRRLQTPAGFLPPVSLLYLHVPFTHRDAEKPKRATPFQYFLVVDYICALSSGWMSRRSVYIFTYI